MAQLRPFFITGEDAEGEELQGLPLHEKAFQENWLQELLFKHPSILPVELLDEAFAPLIPIGREIASTDNLFISPSGLLTIVETKLWRNPEAHRTVIAQLLEYTKTLSTWDYEQLDEATRAFMQKRHGKPTSLYGVVKERSSRMDLDEMEFKQMVQDSLGAGRFALFVVGDRIYPSATQLADVIQSAPHLQFSMSFVELQCYRLKKESNWPLVVIPRLVTKTREEIRAVVKVIYEKEKPELEITAPTAEEGSSGHTSFSQFIASLPSKAGEVFGPYIEKWMKDGYTVYWGESGFSVRIDWHGKKTTVFKSIPRFASVLQQKRAQALGFPESPYSNYRNSLMESRTISSHIAAGKKYIAFDKMSDSDLELLLDATDNLLQSLFSPPAGQGLGSIASGPCQPFCIGRDAALEVSDSPAAASTMSSARNPTCVGQRLKK